MNKMLFWFGILLCWLPLQTRAADDVIYLTLIPPSVITNKVDLDIRAGVKNPLDKDILATVCFYLNREEPGSLLYQTKENVRAGSSCSVRFVMPTAGKVGDYTIILVVKSDTMHRSLGKNIKIINSNIRSTQQINGAWVGLYHWSETEGKMWNPDIKKLTMDQWKEMVRSMHQIRMNLLVIQESFRNEMYVDKHHINLDGYQGKAFYPSSLYPGRMPIAADDPLEAILSEADKLNMNVFLGVGMFAWFDFTAASLKWHKHVALELFNRYGNHPSFYGWYISEENSGGLDAYSSNNNDLERRQRDIVSFFKGFKTFSDSLTPGKPVMLATSSYDVPKGEKVYPALLQYLDILCPFGFARMPEGDLTGEEAAQRLQQLCNNAQSHLWFDLEAFLFHNEGYLIPRPINEIIHDLTLFDNFEETLCYQYPGVFNNPEMSVRVGEESTIKLYLDYLEYLAHKTCTEIIKE